MPPLEQAAAVASAVAEAVALVGVEQGLARLATTPEQARQRLAEAHWGPEYQPLRADTLSLTAPEIRTPQPAQR